MRSATTLGAVVATVVAVLGGCSTPAAQDPLPAPAADPWAAAIELPYSQEGCSEAIGVLIVDPLVVEPALPAGYAWRDASELFGLPVPLEMAAVAFNLVACPGTGQAGAGEAFEGVFVHPPQHNATTGLPASLIDFYQLAYYTGNATMAELLGRFGVPGGGLVAESSAQAVGVVTTGKSSVRTEAGDVHAFESLTSGSQAEKGLARFWTETANGTAVFDYNIDQSAEAGTVLSCSFGPASAIARQLGITGCRGQEPVFALRFPVQSWTGTMRLLPA